ncbi:hypothetical protein WL76_28185 [Burkholderia ubonensis]|uniref:hypothetical protein n=1 Tax=Burkholderia ubonensis TaxID=101571 RepID=UPI00075304E8|nr:hypothetical protein [Burkholderia ubonensis]KWE46158.1 hypothetical protein WL76_28185 [Burkholderia ubonensis]
MNESASIREAELAFRVGDDDVAVPFRYEIASNNAVLNLGMVLQGFGLGLLPSPLVQDRRRRDRAASRVKLAHAAARQGANVHRPCGRILRRADAPSAARVTALAVRSRHPGAAGAH